MRVYALLLLCAFLSVYAFRDWFKSLCGLILIMAFIQHPDFPTNIAGIQGANPWNLTLLFVVLGWAAARRGEGLVWDMPHHVMVLLFLYALVIVIGFVRMFFDRGGVGAESVAYIVSEYIINCFKWVIPGLLLFDGCRSRPRFFMALVSILGVYFLLALQVIRWMPTSALTSGTELNMKALKIIANEVGYHPVNMSMMLAGASWAMIALVPLATRRWHKLGLIGAFFVVSYGQALTGGRMGYVTWGIVGLILCIIRWRKGLLLAPVVVVAIAFAAPGVAERMMQGFGESGKSGGSYTDDYKVTSGRTLIWPYVIEEIWKSPLIGHGRLAMLRTGVARRLMTELDESFPHPHNAYLECLLDNGLIGAMLILLFYLMVLYKSIRLFLAQGHPAYRAAGGVCLALVLSLLVAAMGSQTFYPREGSVGMWATIGVMLRTYETYRARIGQPVRMNSAGPIAVPAAAQ